LRSPPECESEVARAATLRFAERAAAGETEPHLRAQRAPPGTRTPACGNTGASGAPRRPPARLRDEVDEDVLPESARRGKRGPPSRLKRLGSRASRAPRPRALSVGGCPCRAESRRGGAGRRRASAARAALPCWWRFRSVSSAAAAASSSAARGRSFRPPKRKAKRAPSLVLHALSPVLPPSPPPLSSLTTRSPEALPLPGPRQGPAPPEPRKGLRVNPHPTPPPTSPVPQDRGPPRLARSRRFPVIALRVGHDGD
jgi:hypothetical protein